MSRYSEVLKEALLCESLDPPGIHHYLNTHDVVYHGTHGRFRVYSAVLSKKPSGVITDLTKAPRIPGTSIPMDPSKAHRWSKPPRAGSYEERSLTFNTRHPKIVSSDTHRSGYWLAQQASRTSERLDRLGLPKARLTVVVTNHPHVSSNSPRSFGKDATGGSPAGGFYSSSSHHAAISPLEIAPHADVSHTLAHEWAHHYQKNLHKGVMLHIRSEFDKTNKYANAYGKTNPQEWHATAIEGAVVHDQKLARRRTTRGTIPGSLFKRMATPPHPANGYVRLSVKGRRKLYARQDREFTARARSEP